jgi:hypothetical protein
MIFVTGVAKVAKDDPIASSYDVFFVSLVVDKETGVIVDATCNSARERRRRCCSELWGLEFDVQGV